MACLGVRGGGRCGDRGRSGDGPGRIQRHRGIPRRGVPSAVHEANIVMGRANKALAARVTAIAGGFLTEEASGHPEKYVFTGNPVRQPILDALHLCGQLTVVPRPDVGLEHEPDPGRARGDDVDGALDHRHHLVPLPLDVGEHRVRLVGQPGLADHPDGGGT